MGFPIELNSVPRNLLRCQLIGKFSRRNSQVTTEKFSSSSLTVAFSEHNLRFLDQLLLLRSGGDVRGRGRAGVGAGHHLLADLADLQLEADLVGEHLDVLRLEGGRRLVGREQPLLVEQLHYQLPSAVQSLSQAC